MTDYVSANALLAQIDAGIAPTILDVRSGREFAQGHVPGALNIPFWMLPIRRAGIRREDRLVVYCGHGPRAAIAGAFLRFVGCRQLMYLIGHMSGWKRAGLRLEHGSR